MHGLSEENLLKIVEMRRNKTNPADITEYIKEVTGKSFHQDTIRHGCLVSDWLDKAGLIKTYIPEKRPVGVFGDTHIPFDHPNYLQFLKDTFQKYNVDQVVCMGDLVDNHAISRHQTETCAKSAYDELDMSIERVAKYVEAFPNVKMCIGNHCTILQRQAATLGIGDRFLKPYNELFKLPDTWEIEPFFIIDNVLYKHGIGCTGRNGAINAAIAERMSTVIGHSHSFAGIDYSANKRSIIFGMNVGSGVDNSAYAFNYSAESKNRSILGCGIVYSDTEAYFINMPSEYFRN